MHVVWKLVRPIFRVQDVNDQVFLLRQEAELEVEVLQLEVSVLDLIDELLSDLRVDRYVLELCFRRDLLLFSVLSCAKSLLVHVDDDKLAFHPVMDFLFGLAHTAREC